MNTSIIIILFSIHLILNWVNLLLGHLYISFFSFLGRIVHAVLFYTEKFYEKYPQYKEKLFLQIQLMIRDSCLHASTHRLMKSQLKNKGNKDYYSFTQKLFAVMIYLVFLPNEQEIKVFLSHKLKTILNYISLIKNKGILAVWPKTRGKNVPHNKKSIEIIRLIWKIHDDNPSWGRFKIAFELFKLGILLAPSTVRNHLLKPRPPKEKKTKARKRRPDTKFGNKKIKAKYPGHVWNMDFTTFKVLFRDIYIFFVIDIFSRKIIHFDVHLTEPCAFWTVQRLKAAFAEAYDTPKYIITDHGPQFDSDEFKGICSRYGIGHRMGKIASFRSNTYIERFNQTIKYEALNYIPFFKIGYLINNIVEFIDYYNNYRPHQSLDGLTPEMKYSGIVYNFEDCKDKVIKSKSFCNGLITTYYLDKAA